MPSLLSSNNPGSTAVVQKVWAINPNMVIRGMIELYGKNPSALSRIVEVSTQDLRVSSRAILSHILGIDRNPGCPALLLCYRSCSIGFSKRNTESWEMGSRKGEWARQYFCQSLHQLSERKTSEDIYEGWTCWPSTLWDIACVLQYSWRQSKVNFLHSILSKAVRFPQIWWKNCNC